MSEWKELLNGLLETLPSWPSVLLPLVVDYVRARSHEWDAQSLTGNGCTHRTTITRTRVEAATTRGWRFVELRSKYSLETGPSRWAIDVEFTNSSAVDHEACVWVSISDSLKNPYILITHSSPETETGIRVDGPIVVQLFQLKTRIYVTVNKDLGCVIFEYLGRKGSLQRVKDECLYAPHSKFDHVYPSVSMSSCCLACTISLVDE